MALSKLEKAMALWIGIEVLKPGTLQPITRKALEARPSTLKVVRYHCN